MQRYTFSGNNLQNVGYFFGSSIRIMYLCMRKSNDRGVAQLV